MGDRIRYVTQLDMDNTMFDFIKAIKGEPGVYIKDPPQMLEKGFFRNLPLLPGTKEFVDTLWKMDHLDLRICSQLTSANLDCATEKLECLDEHFPYLVRKTTLTFDKSQVNGHFLIDDDAEQWQGIFPGIFIWFDYSNPLDSQKRIIKNFRNMETEIRNVRAYKKISC